MASCEAMGASRWGTDRSYQPVWGALRKRDDERQRATEKTSRCRASGGETALRGEPPRRRHDGGDAGGRMGGHSGERSVLGWGAGGLQR